MAIESGVLVVGGGLAGLTAARTAAAAGADVRVVSREESTLRQASGLIDVLGYVDGAGPIADPFAAMAELPTEHPYRIVGETAVRDAMGSFDDAIGGYRGGHTETNALVPTHGGTVKPTARYPASVTPGLASDPRSTLLVGFERLTDFDAPLAAAHLEAAGVPFEVAGVTITFPRAFRADAAITRYARALDRNEPGDAGRDTREVLAETVAEHLGDHERVGLPAILGREDPGAVRESLRAELGVPVFEVPTGPPSLPGLRLSDRLEAALGDAGASVETVDDVVGYDGEDRVEHVIVDRNGSRTPYVADQYVLATGGLVGKGIQSDRERVHEPVFGCHVPHPGDRYEWFEDAVFGGHAFARFGLDVGTDLRPRGPDSEVEYTNLRAAGAVLGEYDFAAEKSGAGVSIATGHVAGRRAGEAVA